MGGCASRPKSLDDADRPEPLLTDAPAPVTVEPKDVAVAEEKNQEGEQQNEAPLVDLSEPKAEETKPEVPVVESVLADVIPAEEKVEAVPAVVPDAAPESAAASAPEDPKPEAAGASETAAVVVAEEKPTQSEPTADLANVEDKNDVPNASA